MASYFLDAPVSVEQNSMLCPAPTLCMKLESKCFIKTFKNLLATNCKEIVTQYTVVLLIIVDIQIEIME